MTNPSYGVGKVYLRTGDELAGLVETPYAAEEILQVLLAKYPDLLAGELVNPHEPRRWLLVAREVAIPDVGGGTDRWSLDHLYLDQDAMPTLVEVKRSSNTQIRREVVGQMLDYAANVVAHWPPGEIQRIFEERCEKEGLDSQGLVRQLLGDGTTGDAVDQFWQSVADALIARRMRLVFVADLIPSELQRIVEFLNESMVAIDVLALEVRQYQGAYPDTQVLVPRIIGRTAAAETAKQQGVRARPRDWNDLQFREATAAGEGGPEALHTLDAITEWATRHEIGRRFGRGKFGPMYTFCETRSGERADLFDVDAGGNVHIQYVGLGEIAPFVADGERLELNRRLNQLPGVVIADQQAIGKAWPTIRAAVMADPRVREGLFEVFEWVATRVRAGE